MKLVEQEISALKLLLQDNKWRVVERVAELYVQKVRQDSFLKDSEWETMKTAIFNEGQIHGIRSFLAELFNQAHAENT